MSMKLETIKDVEGRVRTIVLRDPHGQRLTVTIDYDLDGYVSKQSFRGRQTPELLSAVQQVMASLKTQTKSEAKGGSIPRTHTDVDYGAGVKTTNSTTYVLQDTNTVNTPAVNPLLNQLQYALQVSVMVKVSSIGAGGHRIYVKINVDDVDVYDEFQTFTALGDEKTFDYSQNVEPGAHTVKVYMHVLDAGDDIDLREQDFIVGLGNSLASYLKVCSTDLSGDAKILMRLSGQAWQTGKTLYAKASVDESDTDYTEISQAVTANGSETTKSGSHSSAAFLTGEIYAKSETANRMCCFITWAEFKVIR